MVSTELAGKRMLIIVVVMFNLMMLGVIGATFYVQDFKYTLPTPRPAGFHEAKLGQVVALNGNDHRPTLLCFASPDCGCSRFNQDHLWELSHEFGKSVRIIEVIEAAKAGGLDSPDETMMDANGKLAKECGVYSTPQAVVLDGSHRIAFSGNFNSTRFCSVRSTQFARLAMEAVAGGKPLPAMPKEATTPYGCAISSLESTK